MYHFRMISMIMKKMITHDAIDDYLKFVDENPDAISEEVKLLIKNIVTPTLRRDDIFFDSETLDKCIAFCERWFYPLFPFQKFHYAFVFMYEKENPENVIFRDIFDLMGRGNGKDGYLMPLALFLLSPMYGVFNYNIDIIANGEDQAKDSFEILYDMLEANKKIMRKMFYWNKTVIIGRKTRSRLKYNTSNAKTKDGKKSGMLIFNELHGYEDYKQLNVFTSGFGKVKHARTWTISTNGIVRDGPLDEKIELSMSVLHGEANYLRMFPFICRMKREDVHKPMKKNLETNDPNDIDTTLWEQANPSLRYLPILRSALIFDYYNFLTKPSYKTEFYSKRMNIPMQDHEQALTSWNNILKASYSDVEQKIPRDTYVEPGSSAVVGIDFAQFNDFASVGLLFLKNEEYIWQSKTWICGRSKHFCEIKFPFDKYGSPGFMDFEVIDEDYIHEDYLVRWVVDAMRMYRIQKIVLDSHRYQLMKRSFESYGISVESRDNPSGMIRMIRINQSVYNIVAPFIEKLFVDGTINIGDSAIMRWAINNTALQIKKDGLLTFEKIEPKLRKNDPFMALVHACQARELLEKKVIQIWM